jgi:hypothetical protein
MGIKKAVGGIKNRLRETVLLPQNNKGRKCPRPAAAACGKRQE